MPKDVIDLPVMGRAAALQSVNEDARTVEVVWTTGSQGQPPMGDFGHVVPFVVTRDGASPAPKQPLVRSTIRYNHSERGLWVRHPLRDESRTCSIF